MFRDSSYHSEAISASVPTVSDPVILTLSSGSSVIPTKQPKTTSTISYSNLLKAAITFGAGTLGYIALEYSGALKALGSWFGKSENPSGDTNSVDIKEVASVDNEGEEVSAIRSSDRIVRSTDSSSSLSDSGLSSSVLLRGAKSTVGSKLADFSEVSLQGSKTGAMQSYSGTSKNLQHSKPQLLGLHPVGSEFQVNTYTNGNRYAPSVANLDPDNGNFVIAWYGEGLEDTTGVFAQKFYANGTKDGNSILVNTYTTDGQYEPSVASLYDGTSRFMIAWGGMGIEDASSNGIYAQKFYADGTKWENGFSVNTYTTNYQGSPSIARQGAGFIVTWYGEGIGDTKGIFAQRLYSNGIKNGVEFRANAYTNSDQDSPTIVSLSDDRFVIAWNGEGPGDVSGVFAQRFSADSNPEGNEFLVNSYTTNTQRYPSIASLPGRKFVIVWEGEGTEDDFGIFGQRFLVDGTREGGEFLINTFTLNPQQNPSITSFSSGKFIVAWNGQGEGDVCGIFAQRFDAAGAKEGSAFLVNTNTNTAYYQQYPSVTSLPGEKFVVAWQSMNVESGSDYGIYARTFSTNEAPVLNSAASSSLTSIAEDTTNPSGNTVSDIIVDGSITDSDGAVEAMAITAVDNSNGSWQYSTDGGTNWNPIVSVSDSSSLLLDSAHKIRFVPNANFNGQATFTFRAWDKFSGTAGLRADTRINGDDTPFSTATDTASITVTAVNDAPILSSSSVGTVVYVKGKTPVVVDSAISIADIDSATLANASIVISGNFVSGEDYLLFTDQNGIYGAYNPSLGRLDLTGETSLAHYQSALRTVRYRDVIQQYTSKNVRHVVFTVSDGLANSNSVARDLDVVDAPAEFNWWTEIGWQLAIGVASGLILLPASIVFTCVCKRKIANDKWQESGYDLATQVREQLQLNFSNPRGDGKKFVDLISDLTESLSAAGVDVKTRVPKRVTIIATGLAEAIRKNKEDIEMLSCGFFRIGRRTISNIDDLFEKRQTIIQDAVAYIRPRFEELEKKGKPIDAPAKTTASVSALSPI